MFTLQLERPLVGAKHDERQPFVGFGLNTRKRQRFQRLQGALVWFVGLVGALMGFYLVRPIFSEASAWLAALCFLTVGASFGQLIAGLIDVVVFGSIDDSQVELDEEKVVSLQATMSSKSDQVDELAKAS